MSAYNRAEACQYLAHIFGGLYTCAMSTTATIARARPNTGTGTPKFAVSGGGVLTVSEPGNIEAILKTVSDRNITTVRFAPGLYTSTSQAPMRVSNAAGTLKLSALSGDARGQAAVDLRGIFDFGNMSSIAVENVRITSPNADPPLYFENADEGVSLSVTLTDVTLVAGEDGAALNIYDRMIVDAFNLTLNGTTGGINAPLVVSPSGEDRAALRTTGSTIVNGYNHRGDAVEVYNGVGEIIGNASSWMLEGAVSLRGGHSPAGADEPGKFIFGNTTFSLRIVSAETAPVIRFEKDVVGGTDEPPKLAFVTFDTIVVELLDDFSNGYSAIEVNDITYQADVNDELDTDHDITIRIGRYVEDLTHGGVPHQNFTNNAWKMHGSDLETGAKQGTIV